MDLLEKLTILSDAAKTMRRVRPAVSAGSKAGYIGNTSSSVAAAANLFRGRTLRHAAEVLLTNCCVYDCKYCVNRRSNDTPRAMFTPGSWRN